MLTEQNHVHLHRLFHLVRRKLAVYLSHRSRRLFHCRQRLSINIRRFDRQNLLLDGVDVAFDLCAIAFVHFLALERLLCCWGGFLVCCRESRSVIFSYQLCL